MNSELTDWVVDYLEAEEDIVVPIKKMWNEWHGERREPSLEVFSATVLADERIEDMGGADHDRDLEFDDPAEQAEYEAQMEASGYYSGPRVKLKSRELTTEHIARMISRHSDRMEAALLSARETMPEDVDEMEEGALIEAIELARELRRKLREAGLDLDAESSEDEDEF